MLAYGYPVDAVNPLVEGQFPAEIGNWNSCDYRSVSGG